MKSLLIVRSACIHNLKAKFIPLKLALKKLSSDSMGNDWIPARRNWSAYKSIPCWTRSPSHRIKYVCKEDMHWYHKYIPECKDYMPSSMYVCIGLLSMAPERWFIVWPDALCVTFSLPIIYPLRMFRFSPSQTTNQQFHCRLPASGWTTRQINTHICISESSP